MATDALSRGLAVGDLITTYYAGYYILTKIDGTQFYFEQVLTQHGKVRKGKEKSCHNLYCERVDQAFLDAKIKEVVDLCDTVKQYIRRP